MVRYTINKVHTNQKLPEFLDVQRFRIDLIHTAVYSFLDIKELDVPGDSNDLWLLILWDANSFEFRSDLLGGLIAVEERHVAVHQNKRITLWVAFVN